MKVFMYEEKIINLAEVKYIDTFCVTRSNIDIRFHMIGEGNDYVSLRSVKNTDVPKILEECYKIMKEED